MFCTDNQSPDPSSQPYTSDKADPASPSPSPLEAAGSGATLFNYQTYNQQLYGQARQPPQPSQVWPGHEGTQAQNLYQVQQPYQGQQVHQAQQTYQSTQTYKGQQGYWDSKTYLAQQNLQRQTPQYGQQQYGQTASPYAAQGLHSTDANITTATQSQTGAVQPQPKVLRGGTPGTAEPLHPGRRNS
jgi:hypothetical protein